MSSNNEQQVTGPKISRKEFVKSTSLAAGSFMIGSLPFSSQAQSAGDATIKIALVGCGGRGTGAARQALSTGEGVELVAMADAFRDRLEESYDTLTKVFADDKDKLNVPEEHKFTGFDAYKDAISLADVVILATPPGFRPAHFEEAVKADKHVFMEKPLATDAPGVRKVLQAGKLADQKGLNVVVGLQRRYQNSYREALKRVRDGQVGDIM